LDRYIVFDPLLLGVGLAFAGLLVLTLNTSPLTKFFPAAHAALFLRSLLAGVIALAVLSSPAQRLLRRVGSGNSRLVFGVLAVTEAVLLLLATLLVGFVGGSSAVCVAGICSGIGFLMLINQWGYVYSLLLPENALFHAALSLGVASLAYPLCALLLPGSPMAFALILALLSALAVLPMAIRAAQSDAPAAVGRSTPVSESTAPKAILGATFRTLWKPLLSAVLSAFIIGLAWSPSVAQLTPTSLSGSGLVLVIAAPLLVCAAVVVTLWLRPRAFTLHLFCEVVMPVAIAVLLVAPIVSGAAPTLTFGVGFLVQMCFAVIALAAWTSLANGVRTIGAQSWALFSFGAALLAAIVLLGIWAIDVVGTGGQAICLALFTLFLVLMVVDFALRSRSASSSREVMRNVLERYLVNRCDELAEQHSLSAREREVFGYLARGYSHVYIAKELYVSENTVHTHVKHIYTKLGISSKAALLQLIDE
jgi:DNA-binding CsgD family transcriptional regulator